MKKKLMVSCPYCKEKVAWQGNKWRPFCSERCKMIDLGKWASEDYKVSEKNLGETYDSNITVVKDSSENWEV